MTDHAEFARHWSPARGAADLEPEPEPEATAVADG